MMRATAPRSDELRDEHPARAVHLPVATIVKVLLALVALWAIYKLASLIAVVLVAVVSLLLLSRPGTVNRPDACRLRHG